MSAHTIKLIKSFKFSRNNILNKLSSFFIVSSFNIMKKISKCIINYLLWMFIYNNNIHLDIEKQIEPFCNLNIKIYHRINYHYLKVIVLLKMVK